MRKAIVLAVLASGCIDFGQVLTECQKPGGRCAPDAGAGGSGGGGAGAGGGGGGGGAVDAGSDAGVDAGRDGGPDGGVDAGVDAGPCLEALCFTDLAAMALVKGMDGVGDDELWVAGGDGGAAFVARWNGSAWSDESPPGVPSLQAIDHVTPDHVWVAGDNGMVARRFNGAWLPAESMGTATPLYGIWVSPTIGAFAVGESGRVFRREADGGWILETSGGGRLRAVWGSSDTDIYAGGANGLFIKREPDSGTWLPQPVTGLNTATVATIWGSGPNDIWVASQQGNLFHSAGQFFDPVTFVTMGTPQFVHGTGPNDAWLATSSPPEIYRFDGGNWAAADAGLAAFDAGFSGPYIAFVTPSSAFFVIDRPVQKQSHVLRYRRGP